MTDEEEFEILYKESFPEFYNYKPLPHLAHLEGAKWGWFESRKTLREKLKPIITKGVPNPILPEEW